MSRLAAVRRSTKLCLSGSTISLATACLFAPGAAHADFAFQPRLNTGMMYYEFEQESTFRFVDLGDDDPTNQVRFFGPSGKRSVSDFMPFVGVGGTLLYNRFYVDLYGQRAFSGEDEQTTQSQNFNGGFFEERTDVDWEREEYSVSFGYAITDNFTLFAGYRRSETEFDFDGVLVTIFDVPNSTVPTNFSVDNEQDGPFIGANYGWRIGEIGTLALNLGAAFIDGEITSTGQRPSSGDTVGLTTGLSWRAPLPVLENFNYTVGIDGYQYDFEADEADVNDEFQESDFQETVIRATAGVSYAFDIL